MSNDRTRNSVLRQLASLNRMSVDELREKWRDLYGSEPPGYGALTLKKRLAYRIQELFYGGLSEHTVKKITHKKPANKKHKNVLPGTRFIREWNDNRYEVIARKNGFEYDGRTFRSLTAIATEITGVKWNGPLFFGLRDNKTKDKEEVT
mgnify:CR=1 FL=1